MASPAVRVCALCLLLGAPAFALDTTLWSKVHNGSGLDATITLSGTARPVGALWIKAAGEASDGIRLAKRGDAYVLKANSDYQFYFDTQFEALALVCTVDLEGSQTVIGVSRIPGLGDHLSLRRKGRLDESTLGFNLAGFRRTAGPVFMTIPP